DAQGAVVGGGGVIRRGAEADALQVELLGGDVEVALEFERGPLADLDLAAGTAEGVVVLGVDHALADGEQAAELVVAGDDELAAPALGVVGAGAEQNVADGGGGARLHGDVGVAAHGQEAAVDGAAVAHDDPGDVVAVVDRQGDAGGDVEDDAGAEDQRVDLQR